MFDIKQSNKAYIDAPEKFVVVRKGVVFLRIVGTEGAYKVITATAGEDNGTASAHIDQAAVNKAAVAAAQQLDLRPIQRVDSFGRPYVEVCECEYLSDAYRAAELFFANLDDSVRDV